MHDLVVRERQTEVLGKGVQETERQLVLVESPVDGIPSHIGQRVVHPSHVPLVPEPQSADRNRAGHHRPVRRFLGEERCVREAVGKRFRKRPQKGNRLKVLPAAVAVGNPFTGIARIVPVQHGRDRIDADAVRMEALAPETRAADQKLTDLVPAVVEDVALPVRMEALPRILMFEQTRPVEPRKTVGIDRKVRRDPVQNDRDSGAMQRIHEKHEVLRRSEAAGRGEIGERLVPPRAEKRMLHDRKELDRGESVFEDISGQLLRHFTVGKRAVPLVRNAAPGSRMHFVYGKRRGNGGAPPPPAHPFVIAPFEAMFVDDARRPRRNLATEGEGVRLVPHGTVFRNDPVFVERAGSDAFNGALPDSALIPPERERRRARVPPVEVADNGNGIRIRRPNGESHSGKGIPPKDVRSELVVQGKVVAGLEEEYVVLGKRRNVVPDGRMHLCVPPFVVLCFF